MVLCMRRISWENLEEAPRQEVQGAPRLFEEAARPFEEAARQEGEEALRQKVQAWLQKGQGAPLLFQPLRQEVQEALRQEVREAARQRMQRLAHLSEEALRQEVQGAARLFEEAARQNTEVYRRLWPGERDPDCDPSNRIMDIITKDRVVIIIVAYDVQGGSSGPMKVAKGLTKKKTHKGAKGDRGRERSISGGVEGRDESCYGLEREKGSGGRDGGSMGGGQEEEAVPDIKRGCHPTIHIETNRRPEEANGSVERRGESPDELKWESGSESTCGGRDQERGESGGSEFRDEEGEGSGSVESECRDVKGEGSRSVESECRDAEGGEGSRLGANQDRDGEGEGSSSGESQGQDRGEGSASGENQGGDRNAEGSGSNDDEDERERERQRRVGGDIEQGIQENNREEINLAGIPEAFLAIIGATSIAVIEFHSSGAISSKILSLVMAINVFGFLCCMTSMLHRHREPMAARIFGTIGAAAAGFGLLLPVSEYISSYYGWMILVLGTLAILVICCSAFFPRAKDWAR